MSAILELTRRLNEDLASRQIQEGFRILAETVRALENCDSRQPSAPHAVLCIAEWVDAGYSDQRLIDSLLHKFSPEQRRRLPDCYCGKEDICYKRRL